MVMCYACDALTQVFRVVYNSNNQVVFVGSSCRKQVMRAEKAGWQPAKGGPRLFSCLLYARSHERKQNEP